MNIKDCGYYAFPCTESCRGDYGMTLRDWFAGMALQGHISSDTEDFYCSEEQHAKYAYRCADAMLKARGEIET